MASSEHVGAQFKGVLHGYDEGGSKYSMPYEVSSRSGVLEAGKEFAHMAGKPPTEHSHEGRCSDAGCNFSDIDYGWTFNGFDKGHKRDGL